MQSLRTRLTISYTIALTATIVVFGAALYWERRQSSVREAEQQLEVRLTEEFRFAIRWLQDQARQGQVVGGELGQLGMGRQNFARRCCGRCVQDRQHARGHIARTPVPIASSSRSFSSGS